MTKSGHVDLAAQQKAGEKCGLARRTLLAILAWLLFPISLLALPMGSALGDSRLPPRHPTRIHLPSSYAVGHLHALATNAGGQSGQDPGPPVDFDGGLDARIREVSLHNLLDFDDNDGPSQGAPQVFSDAHFFRGRHRIWGQLKLRNGNRLYSRFTAEWRKYLTPYLTPEKTEIILDNLYLDIPKVPGLPISLRVGRQDLSRGEGFVLHEGGPNDGTRSIFHNAILLGFGAERLGLGKTKVEVMAIRNPAWDEFVIANGPTETQKELGTRSPMQENDDTAFGCYLTNTSLKIQTIECYYFYKEEEAPEAKDPHLKLHTIGTRLSGELPAALDFAIEGAYQFGTHETAAPHNHDSESPPCAFDHRSFGGYAWLSRSVLTFTRPTFKIGFIYLSGDDPGDLDDAGLDTNGWVPIFSQHPKWSELYPYTLATEPARMMLAADPESMMLVPDQGRVSNWTNMASLHAGLTLHLTGKIGFAYTYYYLRAPESLAGLHLIGGDPESFFGDGRVRGSNHQWQVSVNLSNSVSWHFLAERFAPGNFYAANDDAYFLRWDLTWTK